MDVKLTTKAQEMLNKSIEVAKERSHCLLMPEHLLLVLVPHLNVNFEDQQKITFELNQKLNRSALGQTDPQHSAQYKNVLMNAIQMSKTMNDECVAIVHLILALCQCEIDSKTFNSLKSDIEKKLKTNKKKVEKTSDDDQGDDLPNFAVEMVQQAREGKFDPVTGRENEIRSVIEILSKKTKSNPILVGNPGVGKTAIVSAIASMIANDELPTLRDYKIYNVDIGSILAGATYRGQFEERFKKVLAEAIKDPKTVLFIDEIHMAINAGSGSEGAIDAANMLKPALASGEIKCIGATTYHEYRKYIEKDPAFARRFVKVSVSQPTFEDSVTMLRGLRERMEAFHGTRILDTAIVAAVKMAKKYVPGRMLPDSAIDLLDTACAAAVISVESESPEALKIKGKLWSLNLEKASLELDLKRKYPDRDFNKLVAEIEQGTFITTTRNLEHPNHEKNGDPETVKRYNADTLEQQLLDVLKRIKEKENELLPLVQAQAHKKELLDKRKDIQQRIDSYMTKYHEAVRKNETYAAADIINFCIPSLKEELERLKRSAITEINPCHVEQVISQWTGIPMVRLALEESDRLLALEDRLTQQIFGQDEAVKLVSDALITSRSGLSDPNKPIGAFLFLGPTGVGKTELAKALCYEMFDSNHGVFIDMSDYSNELSVTKLIGVSAGYVGYDEGGRLTEPIKNKPYNLILFDEVDLAHPSVFNILYQLIDEGRVVDGKGTEVDFTNCIVILTSNLGYMNPSTDPRTQRKQAEQQAIRKFGPALFNRIDAVIHFNTLKDEQLNEILNKQLQIINERMKEKNMLLQIHDSARAEILRNAINSEFGARPLKKYLQRNIVNPVAKLALKRSKDTNEAEIVTVNCEGKGFQSNEYFFDKSSINM